MKITNFRNLTVLLSGVIISTLLCVSSSGDDDIRAAVSAGQKAPIFKMKTVDGKSVNFPADYKGKVVLLDFWATWCPPCRAELPNVVAAYQKYHDKGFDVLSVSLDEPRQGPAFLQFVHDHDMTWPQIYDGQYWQAAVAVEYGVDAIPCPVLVDGDTGLILAVGVDALGESLTQKIETTLAAKAKLKKVAPDISNESNKY
jgi:thiol-disulfide isomerase/thioredoxin